MVIEVVGGYLILLSLKSFLNFKTHTPKSRQHLWPLPLLQLTSQRVWGYFSASSSRW